MRPSTSRPAAALAVVVAVVVTALVGIALSTSRGGPASSTASMVNAAHPNAAEPTYVAMGSSFAAGPGEGPVVDHRCLRTADNYPSQLAEKVGLKLVDVSCSGSTAAQLVTGPKSHHVTKRRPQVEAVDHDTRLVTITTGGNDIDFIGRIMTEACTNMRALGVAKCGSGRLIPVPPNPADYARLEASLIRAVDEIKARGPNAEIVLVDYTPVVAINAPQCSLLPLAPWQVVQETEIARQMSEVNQRVAARTGAQHVVTTQLAAEHSACGPQPWVRGFGKKMVFHPNAAGKTGIADLVASQIRI
ncbi:SGNH/GDSL hydrolase family protein [Gordonia hydrophobica]|nr:SGNH/GDSL hydrolase family protein [Gordonia hydrophobica]